MLPFVRCSEVACKISVRARCRFFLLKAIVDDNVDLIYQLKPPLWHLTDQWEHVAVRQCIVTVSVIATFIQVILVFIKFPVGLIPSDFILFWKKKLIYGWLVANWVICGCHVNFLLICLVLFGQDHLPERDAKWSITNEYSKILIDDGTVRMSRAT